MRHDQLAKIVSWAGTLHSRKRLQKVVYLLQSAGCAIEADYILHHYGPYSEEVARLTDEMTRTSLFDEQEQLNGAGKQYSYTLTKSAAEQLCKLDVADMARFEDKAKALLRENLQKLEYASTIVYFRRQGCDWDEAVKKASTFKSTSAVADALPLARSAIA